MTSERCRQQFAVERQIQPPQVDVRLCVDFYGGPMKLAEIGGENNQVIIKTDKNYGTKAKSGA